MTASERLNALRKRMDECDVDAYAISSSDPHQSEYPAGHWKIREWLSGFTGSAGFLVVTRKEAHLWTDSRYFIQAERELAETPITLQKLSVPHTPEYVEWLKQNLPRGSTLGLDGRLFSHGQMMFFHKHLDSRDIDIRSDLDLVSAIWKDRPPLPEDEVFMHPLEFAGLSREEKIDRVRAELEEDYLLISTLDDIAWLLNLRGTDVPFNPVFLAYLLVGKRSLHLFINEKKIPGSIATELEEATVRIHPYEDIYRFLEDLPESRIVRLDSRTVNEKLYSSLMSSQCRKADNIVRNLKAVKTEAEIAHIRNAMKKDGVALCKLFRFLEKRLASGEVLSEYELAQQLARYRQAQDDYYGESFPAIVGYGSNGAIVHYRPEENGSATLKPEGILLLDSGGQYMDGTTDITRTVALGEPTPRQKLHYTLVLKGHIGLAEITFPKGTTGTQLDILARMHLWQEGLNYGHGTGHGVGYFLNVHEPPQGISPGTATSRGTTPIRPGMLTSNEPGFYKEGAYGIRIENLVLCVEKEETEFGHFYSFETLSLFPIDLKLVEEQMLNDSEKEWLQKYHEHVYEKLAPLLSPEEQAWLEEKCQPL